MDGQLTVDFTQIMEDASKGIGVTELISNLDNNLVYGGARRISTYEADLLEQMDAIFDSQIKMEKALEQMRMASQKEQKRLQETDDAIDRYCSEDTKKKILLARGWQFSPDEKDRIEKTLSDKELIEKQREESRGGDGKTSITMKTAVKNAISQGVSTEDIADVKSVEQNQAELLERSN